MTNNLKNKLVEKLRLAKDNEFTLEDFSGQVYYGEEYSISEFVNEVSNKLEEHFKEVLYNKKELEELSLSDTYADVIEESDRETRVFTTHLLVIHKDSNSISSFIKDVFDNIDDNVVAEIMDKSLEKSKTPIFIKVALESTMKVNESHNSHKNLKSSEALFNDYKLN